MNLKTIDANGDSVDADGAKSSTWPPRGSGNESIRLPDQIYYDRIHPLVPPADRPILNKRTGGTRYYAGERVAIDMDYLKKFGERGKYHGGDAPREGDGLPSVFEGLPFPLGNPGTTDFAIVFPVRGIKDIIPPKTDPSLVLEILRYCRSQWDLHLSKLPTPSARLLACLNEFWKFADERTVERAAHFDCQLLFPKGGIDNVIKLHYNLDPCSVNGAPSDLVRCWVFGMTDDTRETFPNNILGRLMGVLVPLLVLPAFGDFDEEDSTRFQNLSKVGFCILASLLKVADLTSFFEPLEVYPEKTISKDNGMCSDEVISVLSSLQGCDQMWEPGQSIVHCMRHFYHRYTHQHNLVMLHMLIGCLEACGPVQSLRFEVGDEVECYTDNGWEKGKVQKLWVQDGPEFLGVMAMKSPYQVSLDGGNTVYGPHDTDQYVRAPLEFPALRFSRGDLVLASTINGFEEGVIHTLWVKHLGVARWLPCVIELRNGEGCSSRG